MFGNLAIVTKVLRHPVAKFILMKVVKEIFAAEFLFGGKTSEADTETGKKKLELASTNVRAAFINKRITVEPKEIVKLVQEVVDLLNALGVFDDDPGLNFSDLGKLFEEGKDVFEAIMDLID